MAPDAAASLRYRATRPAAARQRGSRQGRCPGQGQHDDRDLSGAGDRQQTRSLLRCCGLNGRPARPQSTPRYPPQSGEKAIPSRAANLRIEALGTRMASYCCPTKSSPCFSHRRLRSELHGVLDTLSKSGRQPNPRHCGRSGFSMRVNHYHGWRVALQGVSPQWPPTPSGQAGELRATSVGPQADSSLPRATPQVTGDPRVSGKHVNLRLYQVDQRQGNKNQQYSKGLPDGHFPVDICRMVQ